jgi:hypothetical protein
LEVLSRVASRKNHRAVRERMAAPEARSIGLHRDLFDVCGVFKLNQEGRFDRIVVHGHFCNGFLRLVHLFRSGFLFGYYGFDFHVKGMIGMGIIGLCLRGRLGIIHHRHVMKRDLFALKRKMNNKGATSGEKIPLNPFGRNDRNDGKLFLFANLSCGFL